MFLESRYGLQRPSLQISQFLQQHSDPDSTHIQDMDRNESAKRKLRPKGISSFDKHIWNKGCACHEQPALWTENYLFTAWWQWIEAACKWKLCLRTWRLPKAMSRLPPGRLPRERQSLWVAYSGLQQTVGLCSVVLFLHSMKSRIPRLVLSDSPQ